MLGKRQKCINVINVRVQMKKKCFMIFLYSKHAVTTR